MKTLILGPFVLLAGCVPSSGTKSPANQTAINEAFKSADARSQTYSQPPTRAASPLSNSSSSNAFTDEAFNGVKAAFEKAGARVERDMTTPGGRTVRIYLPLNVAMEMTELKAKTLATSARARLSEKAIVYIKGPDGNTLGKAMAN